MKNTHIIQNIACALLILCLIVIFMSGCAPRYGCYYGLTDKESYKTDGIVLSNVPLEYSVYKGYAETPSSCTP